MTYDCIIIGGGAAGLFCAASPAFRKLNGLILEKSRRPGTKLLMSGAGQCNITHSGSIKDFIPKYGKNGGKIRSCLYKYNNLHLQEFLSANGVPTVTRADGKVFPKSMNGKDILNLLLDKAALNGFQLQRGCAVTKIYPVQTDGQGAPVWEIHTDKDRYTCRYLIVATGGCSYPSTGSDGSMLTVLHRDLNLQIEPPRPALTPVNAENYPYEALSGISFEHACLTVFCGADGRIKSRSEGALLLTHENFSGPLILNASRDISPGDKIELNYLGSQNRDTILSAITEAARHSKASLLNILCRELSLPKSFLAKTIERAGESPKAVSEKLTADTFTVKSLAGFSKAMVTAGGVNLTQISCKAMECKNHPTLYIIGEALDIDGETGGYNLQFCCSSARAAAADIAEKLSC